MPPAKMVNCWPKPLLLNPQTIIDEYQQRLRTCKTDYDSLIFEKIMTFTALKENEIN